MKRPLSSIFALTHSRLVTGLLVLGLFVRLAYAWYAYSRNFIPTGNDGYEMIALSLLDRGEYAFYAGKPTAQREPGYPLLIAAAYGLLGGRQPYSFLILQCLMGVGSAWLVYRLGQKIFSPGIALTALAACLFYPQFIYYSAYFYRETLLIFLFAILSHQSAFWIEPADSAQGERAACFGGLAAAGLGLTNSAMLPAVILIGGGLWAAAPAKARFRRAGIYLAPLILGFGAWTARNYGLHGKFIPGSTHGGEEFYQALVVPPGDLGTSRQDQILGADPTWKETAGLPEAEQNSHLISASFRFIANHPRTFLSRALAGMVKYWKPWPYKRNYAHPYWILVILTLVSDAWVVPLGLWGLWLFRSSWRDAPAIWIGSLALTAVYGSIHAVIRYRIPLMGPVILMAIACIARLRQVNSRS